MNLELVDTKDLYEELLNRFDHACFSGVKLRPGDPAGDFEALRWKGNARMVQGLTFGIAASAEQWIQGNLALSNNDDPSRADDEDDDDD